jgi:hypothetical protein
MPSINVTANKTKGHTHHGVADSETGAADEGPVDAKAEPTTKYIMQNTKIKIKELLNFAF